MAETLTGKLSFENGKWKIVFFNEKKQKNSTLFCQPGSLSEGFEPKEGEVVEVEFERVDPSSQYAVKVRPKGTEWKQPYHSKTSSEKQKNFSGKGKPSKSDSKKGQQMQTTQSGTGVQLSPEFHNPYNFVPAPRRKSKEEIDNLPGLNDEQKKFAKQLCDDKPAGHDRYISDKYSGKLRVKMTVATPLLLPDTARLHFKNDHKSYPVRVDEAGKPLIEPTAIKGMLRTAYEALTNSRMSVFQKHDEKLAFRAEVGEGLFAVPARIEGVKGNEEIVLYTGKSDIDKADGGPRVVTRKANGQPGKRDPQFAAWIVTFKKNAFRNANGKRIFQYADSPIRPIDDVANFPLHGKQAWAWIEYDDTKQDRFTFYRVVALAYDKALLGPAPNSKCEQVQGYVCSTGKNIANKHDERFFFNPSHRIGLKKEHIDFWNRLIKDYRKQHESDFDSPPKDKVRGGANNGIEYSLEWSRHIQRTNINETHENANLMAEELKDGTLCYARVGWNGSAFEVIGLFPVMISRRLHDLSPAELLPAALHPAQKLEELSPADRVFGWVRQPMSKFRNLKLSADEKKRGAYRGQIRVGTVECKGIKQQNGTYDSNVKETFGEEDNPNTWLPLQILGQPKPQQGRFYVAEDDSGKAQTAKRNNEDAGFKDGRGLRGRKVYPHHTNLPENYWVEEPALKNEQTDLSQDPLQSNGKTYFREYVRPKNNDRRDKQNRSIEGWVKPNTEFEFDIHFTNLSNVELGALIWLLTLNQPNEEKYFHRFGGGKPLGFGSVKLSLEEWDIRKGEDLRAFYQSLDDKGNGKLDRDAVNKVATDFKELIDRVYPTVIPSFLHACEGFVDSKLPIHYPRARRFEVKNNQVQYITATGQPTTDSAPVPPHPDGLAYEWFVENAKEKIEAKVRINNQNVALDILPNSQPGKNEIKPRYTLKDFLEDDGLPILPHKK